MGPFRKLSIFVIVLIILGLCIFCWWVWKLPLPKPGVDCNASESDILWTSNCISVQEIFYDPTLDSPSNLQPYLVDFKYVNGAGNPIYKPMWYRFRYVNTKTGGYSNLSKWTSYSVMSGNCCLPCIQGGNSGSRCSFNIGYDSCSYNQPVIGISASAIAYDPMSLQADGSFIYMNLHRYVGTSSSDANPPPDNEEGEIVGHLGITKNISGTMYYTWVDILSNPCKSTSSCPKPEWCFSPSVCSNCP